MDEKGVRVTLIVVNLFVAVERYCRRDWAARLVYEYPAE